MDEDKKAHRARHAGRKAEKRKLAQERKADGPDTGGDGSKKKAKQQGNNPKAFAIQSINKARRRVMRTLDKDTKRHHVPLIDRTPDVPPPIVVAVVGPPQVGKSTLIRSLVKRYTKQTIGKIHGPITVVSGKFQRLTFYECKNDLNSMIDIAKVADLVLLMVDGSFGFEMETFEFLNVLQTHGFPRVMGVLTHLDRFTNVSRLRRVKKQLKHRFWTEIYEGAKLFYLSSLSRGLYPPTEVNNLSRFISVMKFRPLIWRNTHPYILADRMEDLTNPETKRKDPLCDRHISVYGYVRGTALKDGMRVHIPGCGDHNIESISVLGDPCPSAGHNKDKVKKRIDQKDKLLYAPMSDVSGITFDKDAVFIDTPDEPSSQELTAKQELITELKDAVDKPEENDTSMMLVSDSTPLTFSGLQDASAKSGDTERARRPALFGGVDLDGSGSEDEDSDVEMTTEVEQMDGPGRGSYAFADTDDELDGSSSEEDDEVSVKPPANSNSGSTSEDEESSGSGSSSSGASQASSGSESDSGDSDSSEDDEITFKPADSGANWKSNLMRSAKMNFLLRKAANLEQIVYQGDIESDSSDSEEESEDADMEGDLFQPVAKKAENTSHKEDSSRQELLETDDTNWENDDSMSAFLDSIRNCFVTGKWDEDEDAAAQLKRLKEEDEESVYGDFEDLETGEVHQAPAEDAEDDADEAEQRERLSGREKLQMKKERMKALFDAEYDGGTTYYDEVKANMAAQTDFNRDEFADQDEKTRVQYEGYRPGLYVRLEIRGIPCELVEHFDPCYPLILGGLLSHEQSMGIIMLRIKRHRWFKKTLKTKDPLIFSMGWRRFQSVPIYGAQDHNGRNRMLKYTPEHMHCVAAIYGPTTPPSTGCLAVQSVNGATPHFSIAATGVVIELEQKAQLVKKLKLTGTPFKIYKHTAFIKGMFNSALEVAKFERANIRTVSGIRGSIKKASTNKGPAGTFRATFEDKILLSDIVFLRAWYPIQPPKLYNPVSSLLQADKSQWNGMRLTGQVRWEQKIQVPKRLDSEYKPIERIARKFNPLSIPKQLQAELPFASKPKLTKKARKPSLATRRARLAEPEDARVDALLQQLNTIKREKDRKRKDANNRRRQAHLKEVAIQEAQTAARRKENLKALYRKQGQEEKRRAIAQGGRYGSKKRRKD